MAVADLGYIASHLGLEQNGLTPLANDANLASILKAIEAKAHEFDNLYSEKLRVDIELENAVVGSEARCQTFKATADKAMKEVEELRQKLKDEESTRQNIQNELQSVKSRSSEYDSEIATLKDRIESLQASNRTNMALLESRNARDDQLSEELSNQHQKNVQLNKEITTLQQTVQASQSAANSAKFKAESLQQQLDLARRSGEWFENELKTKSDDALKFRKEKGAQIAELQRQNEDAKADVDSLKKVEQQLRQRLDAAQAKTEEALVKVQQQQEAFARTEESYKKELENQKRLVEMSDQLTRKHQNRVQEMELEKERVRDNYENEIRRVRVDLERERQTVTEQEERIQQLEGEVDELQARLQHEPTQSAPQTPRANGSLLGRAMSPFGTPGSIRSKTTITATQALDEVFKLKGQLAGEKRRNQQLSDELDQVLATLEAKAPQLNELQSENESLRSELDHMSHLSEQSHEERDQAKRAARKAEGALSNAQTETKILRMQLRDLSTQIQMLVFNMHAREKGLSQLTDEEKYRLEQLSKGEVTEDALSDMSDTHQFITQKFVVFKEIKELQEKNSELLRVTRELAEQMESEEALAAKHQAAEDQQAVQRLQQELANLNDEAQSLKTTMESYKSERDMFRRLLQQKATAGELASILGSEDSQRPPLASIESGDEQEHVSAAALRQLEATFDNYRNEQDSVRQTLRDQTDRLSNEKNSLQSDVVRLTSQLTLASERYDMLHANFMALQGETVELQKRNQSLSETTARQDILTQQATEELVEARQILESTRNEAANLKAEKKIWNDIQERLSKNHESLLEEKERLANLVSAQQSLMNERDITENEARRKSQARIDSLEAELSDTKKKLAAEVEEGKSLQRRKEYDLSQSQNRINELTANLSQVREELVSAKTTRDHLQARVDELTINLKNAEERVGRLQPRPTPRPGMPVEPDTNQEDREQELQALADENSDLKRDLDLARSHLENAQAQADRFRELSQSNEEALADQTTTLEQFSQEVEKMVAEKDAKIRELEQRVEELSSELANSNNQLSALRDSQGEVARRFEDEKNILGEEIKRLKEDCERNSEQAKFHQQDLRSQAEIATKAQQDYEQELVRHAEAAKNLQALRTEYNQLKSEASSLRATAESAKVALAQGESSWDERRQQLEREISELNTRREDANAQNKLLHEQLEGVTAQIAALQQNRLQTYDQDSEKQDATGPVVDVDGLRELNGYLRREKEILEVQHDMRVSEVKRLQQQLEYAQSQLDEARLKLDQERRAQAESGRNSLSHQDLMAKLNELNLYRESSATLRNELAQAKAQVAERNARIVELEARIQPLESQAEGLRTEKSFLEDELKQIQEDRDRWQKRTEDILTKHGRVPAAELDQMKGEVEEAGRKNAELEAKVAQLEAQAETDRTGWQTTRQKLVDQFKERSRKLTGEKNEALQRVNELVGQLDAANQQAASANQQAASAGEQLTTTTGELESTKQEKSVLEKQILEFQQTVQTLREQAAAAGAMQGVPVVPMEGVSSDAVVQQLEQRLNIVQLELETVKTEKAEVDTELARLREQLQTAISERDQAVENARAGIEAAGATANGEAGAPVQQPSTTATPLTDDERKALEEKIRETEARAAQYEELAKETEAKIEQTVKQRSDKMRDTLNNKLRKTRADMEAGFKAKEEEFEKEKEQWKALEKELQLKIEQERIIKAAEGPGEQPASAAPGTPAKQQPPATPTTATPGGAPGAADLMQLSDGDLRKLLTTHATAKSIFSNNLKKRLETESARIKAEAETALKAEYDGKIAQVREQAQMMEQKKATVKINMTENKFRAAQAKLGVVQTAAAETPQRPVVEVWEAAQAVRPNAPGTPAAVRQASTAGTPGQAATGSPAPSVTGVVESVQQQGPAGVAKPPAPQGPPALVNPFAAPQGPVPSAIPNPFAPRPAQQQQQQQQPGQQGMQAAPQQIPQQVPQQTQQQAPQRQIPQQQPQLQHKLPQPPIQKPPPQARPASQQSQLPQPMQHQGQQQRVQSGLPVPAQRGGGQHRGGRGGGAGGGPYVPPQRSASAQGGSLAERGGHGGRGGRGGHRGGMNAGAADFQPGNKRPRGDSEVGQGAKRARGGAH